MVKVVVLVVMVPLVIGLLNQMEFERSRSQVSEFPQNRGMLGHLSINCHQKIIQLSPTLKLHPSF